MSDVLQNHACCVGYFFIARWIGGILQQIRTDNRTSVLVLEQIEQLLHTSIIDFFAGDVALNGGAAVKPFHHTHGTDCSAYIPRTTYPATE